MKTRKLRVYGGLLFKNDGKQQRVVAAVTSQKELSLLTHESICAIRGYWSESGNEREIILALRNPHEIVWIEQ